jgi:hypothetical protein
MKLLFKGFHERNCQISKKKNVCLSNLINSPVSYA